MRSSISMKKWSIRDCWYALPTSGGSARRRTVSIHMCRLVTVNQDWNVGGKKHSG